MDEADEGELVALLRLLLQIHGVAEDGDVGAHESVEDGVVGFYLGIIRAIAAALVEILGVEAWAGGVGTRKCVRRREEVGRSRNPEATEGPREAQ